MIRINLLPFRAAKRRENIRRQVSIYILVAIFLIMAIAYFTLDLNSQLAAAKSKENTLKQEQAKYVKISKKIQQLKQNTESTTSKLKVIKGLEKKKMGPFQLLSEIAWAVPTDKLWLSSLKEQGGILTLTGTAMDNNTVALFMTNLEKTSIIRSVDLKTTKLKTLKKQKLDVTDFALVCKTSSLKEKPKPKPKKGRKRKR